VSIVMGLDQHRGQITGEWLDTETGEVKRTRVVPTNRAAVGKFLERIGMPAMGLDFVTRELSMVHTQIVRGSDRLRGRRDDGCDGHRGLLRA
jgi:hypothetical protein